MNKTFVGQRSLALCITLALAMTSPAFALRALERTENASGLEELAHRLQAAGLEEPAPIDPATVLPNRAEGERMALDFLNRQIVPMVLVFGDVDWLGLLNKLYSKRLVNPVLAELFGILKNEVDGQGGIIYRHGGDEFAFLLPLSETVKTESDLAVEAQQALDKIRLQVAQQLQNRYIVIRNHSAGDRARLPVEYQPRVRAQEQYAGSTLYLLEVPEEERENPLAILPDLQTKARKQGLGTPQSFRVEGNRGVFGLLTAEGRESPKDFPVTVSLGGQVISRLDQQLITLEQYEGRRFRADDWLALAKTMTRWKNSVAIGEDLGVDQHAHEGSPLLTEPPQIGEQAVELQRFPPERVRGRVHDDFQMGRFAITLDLAPRYRWASGAQKKFSDKHGNVRFKAINDRSYNAGDDMIKLLLAAAHSAFSNFEFDGTPLEATISRAPPTTSADFIRIHLTWPHSKDTDPAMPSPDDTAWSRLRETIAQRVERARNQADQYLTEHISAEFRPLGIHVHLDWAGTVSDLQRDTDVGHHFQRLDAAGMVIQDMRLGRNDPPDRVGFLYHPQIGEGAQYGFLFDPIEKGSTQGRVDQARHNLEPTFLEHARAEARLVLGKTGTQLEPALRLDAAHTDSTTRTPHRRPAGPSGGLEEGKTVTQFELVNPARTDTPLRFRMIRQGNDFMLESDAPIFKVGSDNKTQVAIPFGESAYVTLGTDPDNTIQLSQDADRRVNPFQMTLLRTGKGAVQVVLFPTGKPSVGTQPTRVNGGAVTMAPISIVMAASRYFVLRDGTQYFLAGLGRGSFLPIPFDAQGHATVGRGSDNTVVISDANISEQHAVLTRAENGEVFIEDLGSLNGTFVGRTNIQKQGRRLVFSPGNLEHIQVAAYTPTSAGLEEVHRGNVRVWIVGNASYEATWASLVDRFFDANPRNGRMIARRSVPSFPWPENLPHLAVYQATEDDREAGFSALRKFASTLFEVKPSATLIISSEPDDSEKEAREALEETNLPKGALRQIHIVTSGKKPGAPTVASELARYASNVPEDPSVQTAPSDGIPRETKTVLWKGPRQALENALGLYIPTWKQDDGPSHLFVVSPLSSVPGASGVTANRFGMNLSETTPTLTPKNAGDIQEAVMALVRQHLDPYAYDGAFFQISRAGMDKPVMELSRIPSIPDLTLPAGLEEPDVQELQEQARVLPAANTAGTAGIHIIAGPHESALAIGSALSRLTTRAGQAAAQVVFIVENERGKALVRQLGVPHQVFSVSESGGNLQTTLQGARQLLPNAVEMGTDNRPVADSIYAIILHDQFGIELSDESLAVWRSFIRDAALAFQA